MEAFCTGTCFLSIRSPLGSAKCKIGPHPIQVRVQRCLSVELRMSREGTEVKSHDIIQSDKQFMKELAKRAELFSIPEEQIPEEWKAELESLPQIICVTQSPTATKNESVIISLLTSHSTEDYFGALFTNEAALPSVPSSLRAKVPFNVLPEQDFLRLKRIVEEEETQMIRESESIKEQKHVPGIEELEVSVGIGRSAAFFQALLAEEIAAESGAMAVLSTSLQINPILAPIISLLTVGELARDTWFWINSPHHHRDFRLM
mmetsp:Transcript_3175/g.5595  ORF Transcript_3175/g.5595 Transcript_3175/m.5595 type:complete len:261 (-) Transcript_3175:324-1106(-)